MCLLQDALACQSAVKEGLTYHRQRLAYISMHACISDVPNETSSLTVAG